MAKHTPGVGGYVRGCRCAKCLKAGRAAARERRKQNAERLAADPTIVEHGKASTYTNWGCKCEACTKAATAANQAQKRRRAAGIPSTRQEAW